MADISAQIRAIQQASRGEQVRDAIVQALVAINGDAGISEEDATQLITTAINKLDAANVGGNGKYVKSISENDGKITAVEETMDTQPVQNSVKAITSGGVFSLKETLQQNFQAGVDSVYDAVVAKGSTPASKSLSDVIQGIEDIPTGGGEPVIEHNNEWVKGYNIGPVQIDDVGNIWTDGTDVYYSNGSVNCIFDPETLSFTPITITTSIDSINIYGTYITNIDGVTWLIVGDGCYIFDSATKVFKKSTLYLDSGSYFPLVWTDGENLYYSYTSKQYIYDRLTRTWSRKTWSGLTSFNGNDVWTDGTDVYYSNGSNQWVLNKATSTWSRKTWSGLTSFNGNDIWTDGTDVYYSYQSTQYVLNKATSTWETKTWSGLTSFNGYYIWTFDGKIYYSNGSTQYVLDKDTSTWETKTWSGLTNFQGPYIWFCEGDAYLSSQYKLNKETSTWEAKTWTGLTSFDGRYIWTDGEFVYYNNKGYGIQYTVDSENSRLLLRTLSIGKQNVWTDGENVYYSAGGNGYQWAYDKEHLGWIKTTWSGLTSFYGSYIWTDGEDIYFSSGSTQRVLNKETLTWETKTWSGLTSFDGTQVKLINGTYYVSSGTNGVYVLNKSTSTWTKDQNISPNPISFYYAFILDDILYGFSGAGENGLPYYYMLDVTGDGWDEIVITGPLSIRGNNIWKRGNDIYYSYSSKQLVLNKATHVWERMVWTGLTSFNGDDIWSDGTNHYYSTTSKRYILPEESTTWSQIAWSGDLTYPEQNYIWNDGSTIFNSNGYILYKLDKD